MALEYEVEDPSALIEQLLAAGHLGADAVVIPNGVEVGHFATASPPACSI